MLDKHYSCLNYSAISLTLDKRYFYLNHSEISLMLDKRYSYLNRSDITLMLDKRYFCLNHSDIFLIFDKRYFYHNDLEYRADKIRPMDIQTQSKQEALREYTPHPRLVWGSRQHKIESCIQELNTSSLNYSRLSLMSWPTYPEDFMKIHSFILL